jgi:hypothetical protein
LARRKHKLQPSCAAAAAGTGSRDGTLIGEQRRDTTRGEEAWHRCKSGGSCLIQPTANGPTNPPKLPIASIMAIPADTAVPIKTSEGIVQNVGLHP